MENSLNTWNGTVYPPFHSSYPSEYTLLSWSSNNTAQAAPHKAPIGSTDNGWVARPDAGRTMLSSAPIGEPWIMILFAFVYALIRRKRHRAAAFLLLCCIGSAYATDPSITALSFSTTSVVAQDSITVTPTISANGERMVVCWEVFHDAACTHKVAGTTFVHKGTNIVRFAAPSDSGTYYVRTALHYGNNCHKAPFHTRTQRFHVYPSDADIVMARSHQEAGEQFNLRAEMPEDKKLYGVLRFDKATVNNESLSMYQRYNYFISFPFEVRAGDITGFGEIGTDWRICYYDGIGRAREGYFAERVDNWAMIDDTDSILHAYQGYLLQLNYYSLASGSTVWGDKDQIELYFPALHAVSSIVTENETIPALSEAYRCTIDLSSSLGDEGDRRIKDSYWRCIGSPGLSDYTCTADPFAWQSDGLPYLYEWDPTDNSLSVVSSASFTFLPTHAYLVQNGQAIVWTNISKPNPALAARKSQKAASFREFCLYLNEDESTIDRTFVRLTEDEEVSADFDFGWDLSKEMNEGTNLYSRVGHERLAANCLPLTAQTTLLPLGVKIASPGTYTLAMPEGTHGLSVTLIDSELGNRTQLAFADYSVYLSEGTYDDRFLLELAPASDISTDLLPPTDPSSPTRKILLNGQLFLLRRDKVYTLTGQEVR